MQALSVLIHSWIVGDDGATAIEYGMIVAGIGMAIITTVTQIGISLDVIYEDVASRL